MKMCSTEYQRVCKYFNACMCFTGTMACSSIAFQTKNMENKTSDNTDMDYCNSIISSGAINS